MRPEYATFLAACVRERRRELNLSLDDVIAAGGPTKRTLVRVEGADLGPTPKPVTFRRLDAALSWSDGSAARAYWSGEKPHPTPAGRRLEAGTAVVAVPAALALALFEAQIELNRIAAQDPVDARQLTTAVAGLNVECGRLIGLYLTDLLERNRGGDGSIPPLLERAFAGLLDAPVSPEDPDYEDRLYRRWLIGRTAEIPDQLAGRFEAKLRQARKNAGEGPQ